MLILRYLWIIPALPLLGAAINGLAGMFLLRWPNKAVSAVALASTGLSFAAVLELVREFVYFIPQPLPCVKQYFTWMTAGNFRAGFELQVDQLTIVMLLVVTGVGWLIHIYSTAYMAHEGGYYRFFAYLNLFMFFMLILVLASNYVLLFVGWEGVGLSSYLLIGFWFLKRSAADAGKKAFIVNRIGDFGFMLGMLLIYRTFGSLDFKSVFQQASSFPAESFGQFGLLTIICLLLFAGATGKSAQLPLYVWLPDAMEGPTPVSALIHAATMVTAGVYMVARSHVLFRLSPTALFVVAVIGAATALFSATIGLAQNDIKRVLAYSTVSQLGYMFLACGVGAFSAGIFHLMTHSFFKALLFLAAGSVIHALGGEQDMRKMGGLAEKVRWTWLTMLMATLAIAGAPGFSGFFSKDAILLAALQDVHGGAWLYAVGLFTAFLTALYMFRLLFLTFHGRPRFDERQAHIHESPNNMLVPLVILAVLSAIGGWMAAPEFWGGGNHFEHFLAPVFGATAEAAPGVAAPSPAIWQYAAIAVGVAFAGFLLAWVFYIWRPEAPRRLARSLRAAYDVLLHKYYVDEIYAAVVVRPLVWLSTNLFWKAVDSAAIDGAVNGVASGAMGLGDRLRHVHSGNTRSYAVWVVIGALIVIAVIFWPLLRQAYGMVP
jgi:NADH-quinone oxidoreductase subunit L